MIRAVHARAILTALSATAEAGPVFYAINRCLADLDSIVAKKNIESNRDRMVDDLEISFRLAGALRAREILMVRELESKTAQELMRPKDSIGKKSLKEARELLASLGMKLKGDP